MKDYFYTVEIAANDFYGIRRLGWNGESVTLTIRDDDGNGIGSVDSETCGLPVIHSVNGRTDHWWVDNPVAFTKTYDLLDADADWWEFYDGVADYNGLAMWWSDDTSGVTNEFPVLSDRPEDYTYTIQRDQQSTYKGVEWISVEMLSPDYALPRPGTKLKAFDKIFAKQGKTDFMATLALAAYSLETEVEGSGINDFSAAGRKAYDSIGAQIRLLNGEDLCMDAGTFGGATPPTGPDYPFDRNGLKDGIFTSGNAAALVGRSKDALFLAFRGTNDASDVDAEWWEVLSGATPDIADWDNKSDHYDQYEHLLERLIAYTENSENGIEKVFVTGHSLGAAMAEKLTDAWGSKKVETMTFASPGYGIDIDGDEDRQSNIWIDGDPILAATFLADNEGDENIIYHNMSEASGLLDAANLHSMTLYLEIIRFFENEGWADDVFTGKVHGIDYDSFFVHANLPVTHDHSDSWTIGTAAGTIVGSADNDFILGGDGNDIISGQKGKDHVEGGRGDDTLAGQKGKDMLLGEAGDDRLIGHRGDDTLSGGRGKDKLFGGSGQDTLSGGVKGDLFIFRATSDSPSYRKADTITDFAASQGDKIDLSSIDANIGKRGVNTFEFIGRDGYSDTAGELRYVKRRDDKKTVILGDTDGDGRSDLVITLDGVQTLHASDFIL